MKPRLQDYLMIGGALITIFISGYGIGYLFGERRTMDRLASQTNPPVQKAADSWETRTLERLSERLGLDGAQSEKIAEEIRSSAADIGKIRANAVQRSQRVLLDLHNKIETHLDDRQRQLLQRDRAALERTLQSRNVHP